MHQTRENLDIIFRRRTPENVLEEIREYLRPARNLAKSAFPYEICAFEMYDYIGSANLPVYSGDEIKMRFDQLHKQCMDSQYSIFALLPEYAEQTLEYANREPLCKIDHVLSWNSITLRLGQDLFTTAWLAWQNRFKSDDDPSHTMDWPACIHTTDLRLENLLKKGVAENHCHLGGSTQSFSLSWAALMNHPETIYASVREGGRFKKDLVPNRSDFSKVNEKRWTTLLQYAAFVRALLFRKLTGICGVQSQEDSMLKLFQYFDMLGDNNIVINAVQPLRLDFGVKLKTPGGEKCLDYAMSRMLYRIDSKGNNRLLAGERAFLYHCFLNIYKDRFSVYEKSLFYFYLLIKSNFRSELIQANGRNGFYNFLQYQDRKYQFYKLPEYEAEALRLAVCASIEDSHIVSLETRIMPDTTPSDMAEKITYNDGLICFVSDEACAKTFYVTHFAKKAYEKQELDKNQNDVPHPRNWRVRNKIRQQAKAIYLFRLYYCGDEKAGRKNLQARVRGIDACANEVGCRPETFATEFRFLRKNNPDAGYRKELTGDSLCRDLNVTYHVGEDFLDICDGLRAVDEAMEFLEMTNGDRIGHGLVLGTDPEEYYNSRRHSVYMTKQDYLDNCIWILFRTLEWNIPMQTSHREYIRREAYKIAAEIYGTNAFANETEWLEMLFQSWFLRGDHPGLYRSGRFRDPREKSAFIKYDQYKYDQYTIGSSKYDTYRKKEEIAKLYYRYHFDKQVKQNGMETVAVDIKPWFVELMKQLQENMLRRIAGQGIAIECNPTSNKLIGYFRSYDRHPVLQFNNSALDPSSHRPQLMASVNTDDQGVFDTALHYEYALLLCAIREMRHNAGNYNDEQIYEYLDLLRENGLTMVFT